MNEITMSEIAGKTIKTVLEAKYEYEYLFVFTDDSITCIRAEENRLLSGRYRREAYADKDLLQAGLITPETLLAEQAEKAAERQVQDAKKAEAEQQMYAKLKAKFEPGTTQNNH